jgi:hypothetical protein
MSCCVVVLKSPLPHPAAMAVLECFLQRLFGQQVRRTSEGRLGLLVGDELAELGLLLGANRERWSRERERRSTWGRVRMTPRERFAENLVKARRAADFTQEADRCYLHRTEISLLERGGREPRLGMLIKLPSTLDVSLERLCAGVIWDEKRQRFIYKR